MHKKYRYNKSAIAASFSAAATTYDKAAFIEQTIAKHLCERLDFIKIQPHKILDVGCATGYLTNKLQQIYRNAYIIGMDLAFGMTKFASTKFTLPMICADFEFMPFSSQQFDLIFANCTLNASHDLLATLQELERILAPNGIVFFSTYGPNTLQELGLNNDWLEIRAIGDMLLKAGFKDPIVDNESLTFNYESLNSLLQDLSQTGAYDIDLNHDTKQQACQVNVEVNYAIAWKSDIAPQLKKNHSSYIAISSIKRIKNDTVPG